MHEYFAVSREFMRAFINMLHSFDGMMLWFKFDSVNLFIDNSNYLKAMYRGQVQIKVHGNPFKVPIDSGLYYDGCGADFRLGEGLEVVGSTPTCDAKQILKDGIQLPSQVTVCFWVVYFNQRTQKQRKMESKNKLRTLLGSSDGITSLIFFDPNMILLGVTNVGLKDTKIVKVDDEELEMLPVGLKFFETNFEKSKRIFQGWNHITVILDNVKYSATLFLNGELEDEIFGIYHRMNIKYICNHKGMEQPFGYICDLRVYPRCLDEDEVQILGHYQKQIKMLNKLDIIEVLYERKIMFELRRLLADTSASNPETCYTVLECISLLCFASTKMRLEAAKQNIFEMSSQLIFHKNPVISYQANQVILSMM